MEALAPQSAQSQPPEPKSSKRPRRSGTRLTLLDRQALELTLTGATPGDIEAKLDLSPGHVRRLLKSPLAQAVVQDYLLDQRARMTSLVQFAITRLGQLIESPDEQVALGAVRETFKATGMTANGENPLISRDSSKPDEDFFKKLRQALIEGAQQATSRSIPAMPAPRHETIELQPESSQ